MKFATLSPLAFGAGAIAIAVALFLLQRLRVRFREVEVVTTLFWREALEETRARVLVQRFRHPLAYLLVLLISLLVWLAVAGPVGGEARGREHVLLIDGSAGMMRANRFEAATEAAKERAAELPRSLTRVVLSGACATTLLDRDEPLPLLERRLQHVHQEVCPSTLERTILALSRETKPDGVDVEVFGDGPIATDLRTFLPSGWTLTRNAAGAAVERGSNSGVVALGVSESLSGAADRVDLFFEIAGADSAAVQLDGAPVAGVTRLESPASEPARQRFVARDLPARGGTVEVALAVATGDSRAADDLAEIVLPNRPLLRVAISGVPEGVATILNAALAADTGIEVVEDAPDVVIRRAGDPKFQDRSALELTDAGSGAAFVVRLAAGEGGDADSALREEFHELGLADVDAVALATELARPIELSLESNASRRSISMWGALLEPSYDFVQSRAFPRFLARAMRFLARQAPLVPEVAAGRVLDSSDPALERLTYDGGSPLDAAGARLRVPRAGAMQNARGESLRASLLDLATTAPRANESQPPVATVPSQRSAFRSLFGSNALVTASILVALLLLAAEWFLVRGERIP